MNSNDNSEAGPLSLSEEFVSKGSSTLACFPNMWINHIGTDKPRIILSLKHVTCDDESVRTDIKFMEDLVAEITFTAAIGAVSEEGKARVIENALGLINARGEFDFLSYGDEGKREYSTDGVNYTVSKSNDCVSLKMTKIPSEGK